MIPPYPLPQQQFCRRAVRAGRTDARRMRRNQADPFLSDEELPLPAAGDETRMTARSSAINSERRSHQ